MLFVTVKNYKTTKLKFLAVFLVKRKHRDDNHSAVQYFYER